MMIEPSVAYCEVVKRLRSMHREAAGWQWAPGPEPGTVLCRTHTDAGRPHDYLLREQADETVSCTCPDYARSGQRRICKHAFAVYAHGSVAALLAAREVRR